MQNTVCPDKSGPQVSNDFFTNQKIFSIAFRIYFKKDINILNFDMIINF